MTKTAPLTDEQIAALIGGRAEVRSQGQTWQSTIEWLELDFVEAEEQYFMTLVIAAVPAHGITPAHAEWVYDDFVYGDDYAFIQPLQGGAFYLQAPRQMSQSVVMWPVGYVQPVAPPREEPMSAKLMMAALNHPTPV